MSDYPPGGPPSETIHRPGGPPATKKPPTGESRGRGERVQVGPSLSISSRSGGDGDVGMRDRSFVLLFRLTGSFAEQGKLEEKADNGGGLFGCGILHYNS